MLLHFKVRGKNATDLGYLLGKHPDKHQTKDLSFGQAHIFYPEASSNTCSACLLLDIDTTKEMRQNRFDHQGRNANVRAGLDHYVNDRAYVASSLLSTAIAKVYGSALNGNCSTKPELIDQIWPIEAQIAAVSVRGQADLINRFFEPLGYTVNYTPTPLDEHHPEWGTSPYYTLALSGEQSVQAFLQHLYILLPILDNRKHYYYKEAEIEKLLSKANDWLPDHPEQALITRRYFGHKISYRKTLEQEEGYGEQEPVQTKEKVEKISLHQQRHEAVIDQLLSLEAKTILDLGCSTGRLLQRLQKETFFTRLTGADVARSVLQHAAQKLGLRRRNEIDPRIELIQAALTYQDDRFSGYDAALLVEVIEHLDPERLPALEQVVLRYAAPQYVIVTTPNVEYNACYPDLPAGQFRHPDHRFEWDRSTFEQWVKRIANEHSYHYTIHGIGKLDETHGAPSQMAVFSRILPKN